MRNDKLDELLDILLNILEGAARYTGLLLAPAEGFNLHLRLFFALRANNCFLYLIARILLIFGNQ